MKKFAVITTGADEAGEWAHQVCPGLFDTPDSALAEFRKGWNNGVEFELKQLETGTFQVLQHDEGIVEALVLPIETRKVSGRRA